MSLTPVRGVLTMQTAIVIPFTTNLLGAAVVGVSPMGPNNAYGAWRDASELVDAMPGGNEIARVVASLRFTAAPAAPCTLRAIPYVQQATFAAQARPLLAAYSLDTPLVLSSSWPRSASLTPYAPAIDVTTAWFARLPLPAGRYPVTVGACVLAWAETSPAVVATASGELTFTLTYNHQTQL